MQTRQRIFNFTDILAETFSRQNLETFDRYAFLSLTVAKLSTVKSSPVFGPPCIYACIAVFLCCYRFSVNNVLYGCVNTIVHNCRIQHDTGRFNYCLRLQGHAGSKLCTNKILYFFTGGLMIAVKQVVGLS